jgi:hypothetical protein
MIIIFLFRIKKKGMNVWYDWITIQLQINFIWLFWKSNLKNEQPPNQSIQVVLNLHSVQL